jgi:glycosyltransferase involved in cell wall biosynthesis
MRSADVLLLPSVRESGGAVVLEAMASGKPVIVADHGGPSETVLPGTGVRVAARNPEELVDGVRDALLRYASDEPHREREGRAARRHVEAEYTWEGKVDRALALYERVLAARALHTEFTDASLVA